MPEYVVYSTNLFCEPLSGFTIVMLSVIILQIFYNSFERDKFKRLEDFAHQSQAATLHPVKSQKMMQLLHNYHVETTVNSLIKVRDKYHRVTRNDIEGIM